MSFIFYRIEEIALKYHVQLNEILKQSVKYVCLRKLSWMFYISLRCSLVPMNVEEGLRVTLIVFGSSMLENPRSDTTRYLVGKYYVP